MSDETPRLKLGELVPGQEMDAAQVNDALLALDAFSHACLKGVFVNTPPSSPVDGDLYLLGGAPTGAWSGYAYKLATCLDGGWRFHLPFDGLTAFVASTGQHLVYQGGAWTALGALMAGMDASVASAATCDLGSAGALCVSVTGTTTITSFGTAANRLVLVRFAAALTLTHNATSLVLLGGASRVTAANDAGLYRSDASGNWREIFYARAAINAGDAATRSGSETLSNKTFVAPVLGAATGTSLALGGATLGSDALAVTGSASVSGTITGSASIYAATGGAFRFASRSQFQSTADGNISLVNNANSSFNLLQFGGISSSFQALKRNGAGLEVRLADDSGYAPGRVSTLKMNFGSLLSDSADGVILLSNTAVTGFSRLMLGGATSSFPAIKRSGAALAFRLADDSNDAAITAAGATFSGDVVPSADNAKNLGSSSLRWATVYAATGTINTSDADAKTHIRPLQDAELAVARRLASCVRLFQFREARVVKGDAARLHAGSLFQDVVGAFAAEGLEASRYGMVCEDAGGKGLRYEELNQFVIAGLAQRLMVLEAAHDAG